MDTNNRKDVFAQIEYYLVRLLLIALLLIAAYKLLEREIYGASAGAAVAAVASHLQTELPAGARLASRVGEEQ